MLWSVRKWGLKTDTCMSFELRASRNFPSSVSVVQCVALEQIIVRSYEINVGICLV